MTTRKGVLINASVIMCAMGLLWLVWHPQPTTSVIENIHGIPYPTLHGATQIQEQLAHVNVYMAETTFGRMLELKVQFNPQNSQQLAVGVRENGFWLSYPKHIIWDQSEPDGWQEKTVRIPITDAFVDADNSLDIMFFANSSPAPDSLDAKAEERAHWQLRSLSVQTKYTAPTIAESKNFIRSILYRERAL